MLFGLGAVQSTAEIVGFQRTQQVAPGGWPMRPHGHPDPSTLIMMGAYDPNTMWPDHAPSPLFRDVQAVSNQVPQWAWLVAGGALVIIAAVLYNKEKKSKA